MHWRLAPCGLGLAAATLLAGCAGAPTSAPAPAAPPAASAGPSEPTASVAALYRRLNAVRARVGLIPMRRNVPLERAAHNHARYLAAHPLENACNASHGEQRGGSEFTGRWPWQRAYATGYESRDVRENAWCQSARGSDVRGSEAHADRVIRQVMSGIYHRFSFLSFDHDAVGIGEAVEAGAGRREEAFVFKTGNSHKNALCAGPDSMTVGASEYYSNVCRSEKAVEVGLEASAARQVGVLNPALAVWPPDGAAGVSPVFANEIPDPLPDYRLSGYPVTVQFNPYRARRVEVLDFTLYREGSEEPLSARVLDASNDPHAKLTRFDFALFPLVRLSWDTLYRAEVKYRVDGAWQQKTWRFRTERPGVPMYKVGADRPRLRMRPGVTYAVYVPPSPALPTVEDVEWRFSQGMRIDVDHYDVNTLLLGVDGQYGDRAVFVLGGREAFELEVATQDDAQR
ncbi:MAG: CAP domain-containing protein [Gammaproteobacteria bacterium]|nr:CAP domain-containing protein [Gammaproteobacteria bacterium]NIR84832.1 CAP domain-containing protein [Gammaproteobacteria bacterium]NIR91546.1 CAP domain-containing protein [Gammaproteobacteria bacterium]NIU05879.1 CAP domain-containing protein [Gammaproteobacteria bacterium]NIV76734.1 hypothetical protein [Gammaproteobacteria bacterium]